MKTLKLWFTDFYPGFEAQDNFFTQLLSKSYIIELDENNPDYLIYSCHGHEFLNYNCVRIFYTGENLKPDFNLCDYAIGFDYIHFNNRYLRFPNFAFYEGQFDQLINSKNPDSLDLSAKKHFCNFIYANSYADPTRDIFFHLLNQYKKVASPGKHLNNISMDVGERYAKDWMFTKIEFQSSCKFSLAFENTSSPGYTTEKLLHAFITGTIPIYWGNPEVTKDFNPKSFINCHDFESFEDVVGKVKEIDNDEEMFLSMLNEPPFQNNIIPENLKTDTLLNFLQNIFEQKKEDAFQRSFYGTAVKYENDIKDMILFKKKYRSMTQFLSLLKKPLKIMKIIR